ncbi:hypothetical protein MNBD_ACTINO01-2278 [hydrothermal vent metagenome]|uniref:Four helix bundle protein n=1 Tax=hydrothermal vent metagenome TaxID=652676 RepID=A0A3B0RRA9_9ZZZZ
MNVAYACTMHDYRKLRVYELALSIAADTYVLTRRMPRSETFSLAQQMNRAAISIVSNIAEGAGRGDSRDFARFLRIARGSACELEAQVTLGERVGLIDNDAASLLRERIEKAKATITSLERHTR